MSGAVRFEAVELRGFRNLAPVELEPGARFNVVAGDNGQGKSNLLEGMAYLASLRSFRGSPTAELVERRSERATLGARIGGPPAPHHLRVTLLRSSGEGSSSRQLDLDGKRPRALAAWIAACPLVVFHPGDLELAQGGPEARRTLLDRILEEIEPSYGPTATDYQRALRSRNRLLRSERPDRRSITSYDPILASTGAWLGRARRELLAELAPVTERAFAEISGDQVPLEVRYAPRVEPDEAALRTALERSLEKDLARGFTAEGPHADDVALAVHARAARHQASQGQQRAIVLALKVAELELIGRRTGRVPPLLLDDVSSELDRVRNRRFFALLGSLGGQVVLTTTHPELILLEKDERRTDWYVEAGHIRRS